MPFIEYTDRGLRKHLHLSEKKMTIFGREDHVDFQILKDSLISREHFGIEKDDAGQFVIIDLGSSNGTFLNDVKLDANAVTPINHGDRIKAGRLTLVYKTKIIKEKTSEIVKQITTEYQKGKGFKTIMYEIIGTKKTDKK